MIMIGPGTGVGPFRGFLQERQATQQKGRTGSYLGNKERRVTSTLKMNWRLYKKTAILQRLDTAFSRDQPDKIYVQHRMMEHGAELWAWLKEGAHFYICGDASQMAKEVDVALKKIIQQHSGMSPAEVESYVKEMTQTKRYAKDVVLAFRNIKSRIKCVLSAINHNLG